MEKDDKKMKEVNNEKIYDQVKKRLEDSEYTSKKIDQVKMEQESLGEEVKETVKTASKTKNALWGILVLIQILAILGLGYYGYNKVMYNTKQKQMEMEKRAEEEKISRLNDIENEKKNLLPERKDNFFVKAELIIPKINLITYVMENSEQGLAIYPVILNSPNGPNNLGNTTIISHKDNNTFDNLHKIEKEDTIYLRTNEGKKAYRIKSIKEVDEKNLDVMLSEKKVELTLITCTKEKAKRLVITAEEK